MASSTSFTVMLVYWSAMVMEATLGRAHAAGFSDPARCVPHRTGVRLGDAGRHRVDGIVLPAAVRRRRLADDLGEPRAERPERGTADRHAGIRDAHAGAQQRHGALDPAGHEVAVGRLAIRRA